MGVFDILPGLGGDGEAAEAEPTGDSGDTGGAAADSARPADLSPADFRERAEALTGRSDVPTLDFTVDSLESLDELAAGSSNAVDRVAYGSYLGETIVREYGGEWTDDDGWQVAVELPDDRTTIAVFDAAEMSIAKQPVFAKVATHLEAEGAERTPNAREVVDEPGLDAEADQGETTPDSPAEPGEDGPATGEDGPTTGESVDEGPDGDDEMAEADDVAEADGESEAGGTEEADGVTVDDEETEAGDVGEEEAVAADEDESAADAGTDDQADDEELPADSGEVTDSGDREPATSASAEDAGGQEMDRPERDDIGDARDADDAVDDETAHADSGDDASTGDRGDVVPIYEEVGDVDDVDDSAVDTRETVADATDSLGTSLDDDRPSDEDSEAAAVATEESEVAADLDGDTVDEDDVPTANEADPVAATDPVDEDRVTDTADVEDQAAGGADAGDDPVAPERYVLRAAADELADGWPDWDLDYTSESLLRLDAFIDDQWGGRFRGSSLKDRTVDHEDSGDPLTQVGAYYGEVLVRQLDGEWVATDDGEGAVAVPNVGEKTERVDVFAVARDCLTAPSTFAYRYDALANRLHVDEQAVSDGRADVFDAERDSLTSGDVITQFAATAESFVDEWADYSLDYSPRSLHFLDEIADTLAQDSDLSAVSLADGTDPESLWLTTRSMSAGAYFAAVLLRHQDAQWWIDDDVELVIDQPDGERTVDPVATAADCLRGEGSFANTYAALEE